VAGKELALGDTLDAATVAPNGARFLTVSAAGETPSSETFSIFPQWIYTNE
jgi:hypothetical protein